MPTGYTAGIIDGTIKTFPEFAKLCVRAFGAAIHMKDDRLDTEYEERIPSEYHQDSIKRSREELVNIFSITDEQIIESRKNSLLKEKKRYLKNIEERKKNREILDRMLVQALKFVPPSPEHEEIKNFMIDQLQQTINNDGDVEYYEDELERIELEIKKEVNAQDLRNEMLDQVNLNMEYHHKEYEEEVKRCEDANEWVKKFLMAVNNE
jgi:hypothetical protein